MITEQLQLAIDQRKRTLVALLDNPHPSQVDALFETIDLLIQARVDEAVNYLAQVANTNTLPEPRRILADFALAKSKGHV